VARTVARGDHARMIALSPFLMVAALAAGSASLYPVSVTDTGSVASSNRAAADVLTPEALVALQRVAAPALSPDGHHLLLTVSSTDLAANKNTTEVYVVDVQSKGAPRRVATGSAPTWLPDSKHFAVVTKEGLRVHTLDSLFVLPVDVEGGVSNVRWSPSGNAFSYTQGVKLDEVVSDLHPDLPLAKARVYEDLMVRHWNEWSEGEYSHLFVRSFATTGESTGEAIDLLAGQKVHTPLPPFGGVEQIAWSPDGKELCYTARRVSDPEASTDSTLWIVSAEGGEHRSITHGMVGYDQDPVYSPDGRYIAFSSMERAGFEADRARLMLHDRKSGTNTELLPTFDASPHNVTWSSDSTRIFFTADVQGTTQLFETKLAKPEARPITRGRHAISAIQVAPDARTVYALRTSMERPAEVVSIGVETGQITAVTDFNGEVYAKLALPVIDGEWFEATDGKKIHAWIVKPPNFDPTKKYPFILYCQGGPQQMVGQGFSFRWNFHLMAAEGYVVAGVNRRGLPGFGQAWNDQISKDWGGQAMADLLSVTDAMQARPYVDKARSAAVGASFGGYTVYWLMGNSNDRFACMISHCGVFNLESMYLATEELFFVNWDLGGPYWTSEETASIYQRFSPHRYVQNWRSPLLVIHGEKDFRVPYDQGLQAFTAAQVQGVPSRLLMFPEEGHWVLQAQNGVVWQREFFGWLDRWCGTGAAK
jgi:dipeptidyl aminopeptidase/acylaminoacyl peptidase